MEDALVAFSHAFSHACLNRYGTFWLSCTTPVRDAWRGFSREHSLREAVALYNAFSDVYRHPYGTLRLATPTALERAYWDVINSLVDDT